MNDWIELGIAFITGILGPLSVIFVKNYLVLEFSLNIFVCV
jgi:hypothetical protein